MCMKSRSSKVRYFLHEAPWGATSWKDERVERISSRDDVYVVRGPMCKWGNDGYRPSRPAGDRLCAQGNRVDDKPSRIGKTVGNRVHKQDRRSTVAPPHSFDWWHSPASGKVSAAACKSCAQMFEKRTGREQAN